MKASESARRAVVRRLTGLQIESWRLLREELRLDASALAEMREWEQRRREVAPEMVATLRAFLDGALDLEGLRATLDQRAKTSWDAFGLRGMSGAMWLNKLAKHVPDPASLAERLRAVLRAPRSAADARARLHDFVDYLEGLARDGAAPAWQVQPARAPFFATIWWHVQNPERWPGYQLSARQALQAEEGLFAPTGDTVEDYFRFRDAFRELASALGMEAWELEYLCWWSRHRDHRETPELYYEGGRRRAPAAVRERALAPAIAREPAPRKLLRQHRATAEHTHIQWLLATMGRKLGCRVWIAANDRGRSWQGEPLGDLSIRRLPPLGMDADSQRLVSLIDVVWLRGANRVVAAFEVELTTSVYSGLLRMADLAALAPNLNFPLYIVAPASRLEKVRRELARPSFQALDLPARCGVLSAEALAEAAESIMRWGSDPRVLDRLALRADERVAIDVARRGA